MTLWIIFISYTMFMYVYVILYTNNERRKELKLKL